MMAKGKPEPREGIKTIVVNRKARFDFELFERYECGLVLTGTEVKSLRAGKVSLVDGYGTIEDGEAFLVGVNIQPYDFGNRQNHDPVRRRKLLLHKKEIHRLAGKVAERGFTLVPTQLYFKKGRAKAELALARGKRSYDKRETIRRRDEEREMGRQIKSH